MDARMERGRRAEEMAREYLTKQGFNILHVHWQCGHRELDIVAERGDRLHVVEVRSRTAPFLVEPSQSVQYQKQRFIISAARAYIAKYKISKEVQFDIVSVIYAPQGPEIEYMPNAFYPYFAKY